MFNFKRFLAFATVIFLAGCGSDDSTTSTSENVTVSACQSDQTQRSSQQSNAIDNAHTYVEYRYENNTLWLTHYNVVFNCDERGIGAISTLNGSELTITEDQTLPEFGGMNCLCLYDITIQVDNIEAQSYSVHYIDGLSKDIDFDIDLSQQQEGIVSYERSDYPYNLATTIISDPFIATIIDDTYGATSIFPTQETQVIGSTDEMEMLISDLRELNTSKTDEWADQLANLSMDYDNEQLLVYTFTASCIYSYQHTIGMDNDQSNVTIRLSITSDTCATALEQHYLAYQVSKDIESVTIQTFEHDDVVIDMNN